MIVSIVVAMDEQGVIGANGGLPWRLAADLRNFKQITMGKPIIMGRRTHESIGRALPGRENIILTRQRSYASPAGIIYHSLAQALHDYRDEAELMIIGGAAVYGKTLALAQRIYLTRVQARVRGDAWFPTFNAQQWRQRHRREHGQDAHNDHAFSYQILEREK